MITIDLQVHTIPADHRVWRAFPGSGYRFLDQFTQDGIGFLDLPGFTLPKGNLDLATDLIPRIAMAAELKSKLGGAETPEDIAVNLADHSKARTSKTRGRIRHAIINFYETARSGDTIIIPETMAKRHVLIGEFVGNDVISSPYPSRTVPVPVPARRINWLTRVHENSLSSALSDTLRHQHPFSLVEKSRYNEIMAIAFSSFIYNDAHVSTIYNGNEFLDSDSTLLGLISRLSSAACIAMDSGLDGIGAGVFEAILGNVPADYTCSQESDIHSEGFTRLISSKMVPLVAIALFTVLTTVANTGIEQIDANLPDKIEITNSIPGADPACMPPVEEATRRILRAAGVDTTIKLCEMAREAAQRNIRTNARPRPKPIEVPHVGLR